MADGYTGDTYDLVITGADTNCLTTDAGVTDVYADSSSDENLMALPCVIVAIDGDTLYALTPPSVNWIAGFG